MTVQELITRLQQMPENATVAIGANELLVVQMQRVVLAGETEPREVVQFDWFPF